MVNSSCPATTELASNTVPLFNNGNINFQAHDVGWLLAGLLALLACAISAFLVDRHLVHFTCPSQQRHIVRLLLMVPVFAICSVLAYWDYKHYLYHDLVLECYEAVTIRAFFDLLLAYLAVQAPPSQLTIDGVEKIDATTTPATGDLTRKERERNLQHVIDGVHLSHWMFPFGFVKFRFDGGGEREGELFLWWMRIGVVGNDSIPLSMSRDRLTFLTCIGTQMQYFVLQVLCTVGSIIAEALGDYCESSWSPTHVHVWWAAIVSISISVAMYCVLQLYMPLSSQLAPFQPILKLAAIKLVVFFEFWQGELFSVLQMVGVIKDHEYWTAEEINIGPNSLCTVLEMVCFSLLHLKAFTFSPYVLKPPTSTTSSFSGPTARGAAVHTAEIRTKRWPAIKKCLWLSDVARETGQEARYMGRAMLGRNKLPPRRDRDLEKAFGEDARRDSGAVRLLGGAREDEKAPTQDELEEDLRRLAWSGVNEEGVDLGRIGPDGFVIRPSVDSKRSSYEPLVVLPPPHALSSPQAILALEDLYDGQVVGATRQPRAPRRSSTARYSSLHMQPGSSRAETVQSPTPTAATSRMSYRIGQVVPSMATPVSPGTTIAQLRSSEGSILNRLSTIQLDRSGWTGEHAPQVTTYPSGFVPPGHQRPPPQGHRTTQSLSDALARPPGTRQDQTRYTQFVPPSRRAWRRSLGRNDPGPAWEHVPY